MIRLHLDSGQYEEGLAAYRRYQRIARIALGAPVSGEMEQLGRRLLAAASAQTPATPPEGA